MTKQHGYALTSVLILISTILLMLTSMLEQLRLQQHLMKIAQQNEAQLQADNTAYRFGIRLSKQALPNDCQFIWQGSAMELQKQLEINFNHKKCFAIIDNIMMSFLYIQSPNSDQAKPILYYRCMNQSEGKIMSF